MFNYDLDVEYEEEQKILSGAYDWNGFFSSVHDWAKLLQNQIKSVTSMARADYMKEKESDKPKYARVARVHCPLLRQYIGVSDEARYMYRTLMLEQTQPFNSIESAFGYLGDGDVEYVEVDSYTGQPLDEIDPYKDVGNRRAMQTPVFRDDLALSIIDAYSDEDERAQALQASRGRFSPLDHPEDNFTIDAGISSEPIRQIMEQDLRIDMGIMFDTRAYTSPFIQAFNQRRGEWFQYMKDHHPKMRKEQKLVMFRTMIDNSDERRRFLECLQELIDKGVEPQYVGRQFLVLHNEDWGLLGEDAYKIELNRPQGINVSSITLTAPYTQFPNLYEFLVQFADVILEEEGNGYSRNGMSERAILSACDHLEREMLDSLPDTCENHRDAPTTRWFLQGMLGAIDKYDVEGLRSAGYAAWREHTSPKGAQAYSRTYSIETLTDPENALKKAWTAFYHASEIVALNKRGLKIREILTEEVKQISFALAAWKVKRGEISLSPRERHKLDKMLRENKIGHKLQSEL
jgi:hypothetical protein